MIEVPVELRAALDLIASDLNDGQGRIAGEVIGDQRLVAELARYGVLDPAPGVLVALAAPPADLHAALSQRAPASVITLAPGPLARLLRPLRSTPSALTPDLPAEVWHSLGYARVRATGFQGIGSLLFAAAERIARRSARPDLADRSRIGMLRTLQTSAAAPWLAAIIVQTYARVR